MTPGEAHSPPEYAIIIAGFGGQGVVFAGRLLAWAAIEAGWEVTCMPSYGPEMRGGTANCTVIVAREPIGSPLTQRPWAALVLNQPAHDKYAPWVQAGGYLIVNRSLCQTPAARADLTVVAVPATEAASALGDARLANAVLLGAFVQASGLLALDSTEAALAHVLPEHARHLWLPNRHALRRGAALAAECLAEGQS